MRKESIKFIGDLAWFSSKRTKGKYSSPRAALVDHIRYITRPEECVLQHNLSLEDWGRRADSLLARNSRSRIASKVVFALPNCLSAAEGAELLREFLTKEAIFRTVRTRTVVDETGKKKRVRERIPVKLSEEDFGFAVHEGRQGINKQRNLHAHVVFSSVKDGKKLDINRRELSELHQKWERFLKEKGYHLRKSPVRGEPHYGPQKLRYDRRARASFRHLSLAKKLWREAIEEEQIAKTLERAVQVQPAEGLLSWSEIEADKEERREVATRGEKKGESPPPRPRPQQPVKQVKPVVNRSVQQPVQQPRVRVDLSQRPSQGQQETESRTKDPVKQIREHVERELAEKRKREQQLANEISYSLKKQARTLSESPPPPEKRSYSEKKERMEVGNVNPFITEEVVEERKIEEKRVKEQKLKQAQVYQAEMRIIYRYRYFQGELTLRFRVRATWSAEKRKGIAAFLASVAVALLYGFEFPSEALSFYGKFVEKEALAVREQVKRVIKKPFYPSSEEALKALSVKRVIHVRVRIFEGGKLVEEHNFFLTRESFTILHQYAESVLKRRRPPEPGGQQPPQQPQPPEEEDDYEPPEPGM